MPGLLHNHVAVVTGAGSGIGTGSGTGAGSGTGTGTGTGPNTIVEGPSLSSFASIQNPSVPPLFGR